MHAAGLPVRHARGVSPSREPGWYADSADPSRERWWDGGEWSHVTRPAPERPQRPEPARRSFFGAPPAERPAPPVPPGPAAPPAGPAAPPAGGQPPAWGDPQLPPPAGRAYGADPYGPPGPYAQWRPGVPTGPTTPDGVPLADLGARLGARILDYVITTGIAVVLGIPSWLPVMSEANRRFDTALRSGRPEAVTQVYSDLLRDSRLYSFVLVSMVVSAVYTIWLIHARGATVGKMALGIRVRSWEAEGRPTLSQASLRWLSREALQALGILGALYWVVDSLWPLRDPRRQAIHDKAARTVVVRAR